MNVKGMLTNEHIDNCLLITSVNLLESSLCRPSWISCNMWLTMRPLLSPVPDPHQSSGGLREVSLQPSFTTRCTTGLGIQRLLLRAAAPPHPCGQGGACDCVTTVSSFEFRVYSFSLLLLARCFGFFYRKYQEHTITTTTKNNNIQRKQEKSFSWGPVFY